VSRHLVPHVLRPAVRSSDPRQHPGHDRIVAVDAALADREPLDQLLGVVAKWSAELSSVRGIVRLAAVMLVFPRFAVYFSGVFFTGTFVMIGSVGPAKVLRLTTA
jgi:hypothetical protein